MKVGSCLNEKKRVLFLVDHKYRDLPSLSLIGFFLRNMGYEVKYVALWEEDPVIRSFKPKYLVLPKPIYEMRRLIRFRTRGHKIIVVNTEGNPGGKKTLKLNIQVPPDLFFFWNEAELQINRDIVSGANTIFSLAGCPRTDFLKENFLKLLPSRKELLRKYNLSQHQKTITIATSTANAHLTGENLKRKIRQLNKQAIERGDFEEGVNNLRVLKDMTERMIRHIVLKYPELNIVIKPHPNEGIIDWQDFVASLPKDNIYLSIGEPINHLLKVSDLHVSHNACTTTFESLLSSVPAVEIHTEQSMKLFNTKRLQLPTYIVKTVDELGHVIEKELYRSDGDKDWKGKRSKKLQLYIREHFHKYDGLRCYVHAREIAEFMENTYQDTNNSGSFFINNPSLLWPYLRSQIGRYFSYTEQFVKKLNNRNSKIRVDNSSEKHTDALGRYDNHIKPGDEEYWYKRFDKAGFRIADFEQLYLDSLRAEETSGVFNDTF